MHNLQLIATENEKASRKIMIRFILTDKNFVLKANKTS